MASEAYRGPLLQFEQPAPLCAKLPRPQAKEVDGNVYVRATLPGLVPADVRKLLGWSEEEEARSPGAYPFRR